MSRRGGFFGGEGEGGHIQAVLCQEIQIAYRILISGHHIACDKTSVCLSVCLGVLKFNVNIADRKLKRR
jgi:hypothetical protein